MFQEFFTEIVPRLFSDPDWMPWMVPFWPLLGFAIISLGTLLRQFFKADFRAATNTIPADDSHLYGGHHPDYDGMDVPYQPDWFRVFAIGVGMSAIIASLFFAWSLVFGALNEFGAGTFGELGGHGGEVTAVEEGEAEAHNDGEIFGIMEAPGEIYASNGVWMTIGDQAATGATGSDSNFELGVMVDPLNALLLFMVPIAMLCIFTYSIGYMAHDPRQARFFALICLFAGAMLTLTVADNLMMLFVGWEVMGLCSYMLIGFWFEKESAYKAAIKAFTVTRVADVIMLIGIVYLWAVAGTLNFREILYNPEVIQQIASTNAIIFGSWGVSAASLIGIFLITGTVGKSAQFPLHVWLPDAMEGPTPVSAMIHAAAMVSAGVYALLRMYPLYVGLSDPHHGVFSEPLLYMAIVGSFTALFAATMGVVQRDVKAVLAYSTISQLGFMVAALGIGAYIAAAFHLITHAFFKALLFMAAGSVIHAMEHGEHHVHEHHAAHGHDHDHDEIAAEAEDMIVEHGVETDPDEVEGVEHVHFDPQDMFNMGGLRENIPVTFWTFLAGGLSLAGFPLITAGFWSKDEILADGWNGILNYGSGAHALVFFMLAVAAFLTAFYTARQILLTFWGDHRTEEAEHAGLGGPRNIVSITMQAPLVVLAFFALFAGFIGVPTDFPILGAIFSPEHNYFHHLVTYALPEMVNDGSEVLHVDAPPVRFIPVFTSLLVALGGLYVGWLMYGRKPLNAGETDPLRGILGDNIYDALLNRYYFDELYELIFVRPSKWVARQINVFVDKGILDGILHFIARFFTWLGDFIKVMNAWLIDGVGDGIPRGIYTVGGWLRNTQSGRIQQYLLIVLLAVLVIGVFLAWSSGAVVLQ